MPEVDVSKTIMVSPALASPFKVSHSANGRGGGGGGGGRGLKVKVLYRIPNACNPNYAPVTVDTFPLYIYCKEEPTAESFSLGTVLELGQFGTGLAIEGEATNHPLPCQFHHGAVDK